MSVLRSGDQKIQADPMTLDAYPAESETANKGAKYFEFALSLKPQDLLDYLVQLKLYFRHMWSRKIF